MLFYYKKMIMQEWKQKFYGSQAWKVTRENYKKHVNGLCEKCLIKGLYVPGEIVHHKKHLTALNVNDPSVSLAFDKLELLCRKCHAEEHPEVYRRKKYEKRYEINEFGGIILDYRKQ